MAFYAGLIGVVAYFIIGRICVKIGARALSAVFLGLAGASYIYYGASQTVFSYFIGLTLVTIFINGAAYIGGGNLVTQWFPKKKGLANGFTTMGHNLGSALYVPLISALIGGLGMAAGMRVMGIVGIVVAIIGYIVIRNTPQERGVYPDNVSKEVYEAEYADMSSENTSRWTVASLLKTPEMWVVAIIIGINQLVTTGVMSQMVSRNIELGFTPTKAVFMMTVCALVGLAGSYGFGFIDQKLGVKTAVRAFLIWYIVALGVNTAKRDRLTGSVPGGRHADVLMSRLVDLCLFQVEHVHELLGLLARNRARGKVTFEVIANVHVEAADGSPVQIGVHDDAHLVEPDRLQRLPVIASAVFHDPAHGSRHLLKLALTFGVAALRCLFREQFAVALGKRNHSVAYDDN